MSPARQRPAALTITTEDADYGDHYVYLNGELIGHRPYDGSNHDEICDEVIKAFAGILRERLGWSINPESEPEP
jgi:hypothetical protein